MMGCDIVDDMISNNAISAWEGIRMARLSLLGPLDAPLPQALELLPHSISRYDDLKECMSHLEGVDVVLVDCHDEPAKAREACLRLSCH